MELGLALGFKEGIMGFGAGSLVDLAHACHGVLSDVRTPSALLFSGVHRTTAGRQREDGEACTAGLAPV